MDPDALPAGIALPAVEPRAQGGWQGPDDVVVSKTPLWPRPNRSWRWSVSWLMMVAACYVAVLVPTALRNARIAETEAAVARYVSATGAMDVSSPSQFWTWLHDKWLPGLHEHRHTFPPAGILLYDLDQKPVLGAYGNSFIARPRPVEDPAREDSKAAFWGVGMVLRQHRVSSENCSAVMAGVNRYTPLHLLDPGDRDTAAEVNGAGKCYEKMALSENTTWQLTQYTQTVKASLTASECAKGCAEFGAQGCSAFVMTSGDGFLTAQYTDGAISGARVPRSHPRLASGKQLSLQEARSVSTCFMVSGEQTFACAGRTPDSAADLPARGEACLNAVAMTAWRPGLCPKGGHLCGPTYSQQRGSVVSNLDLTAVSWRSDPMSADAGPAGVGRRHPRRELGSERRGKRVNARALTGSLWTPLAGVAGVSSNTTLGAQNSTGLEVKRYGNPWTHTAGEARPGGGRWSGAGEVQGRTGLYPGGGYGVDLLQTGGVGGITADLQNSGWIDRLTRAVVIDMWILSPLAGHATKASIFYELVPGGKWKASLLQRSGPLKGAAKAVAEEVDKVDAARPSGGVGSGKISRGVGSWLPVEIAMIALQSLVLVSVFVWSSAYSLSFHPRALVPRLFLLFWGTGASILRRGVSSCRRCLASCCAFQARLVSQASAKAKDAMEERNGIQKPRPVGIIKHAWPEGGGVRSESAAEGTVREDARLRRGEAGEEFMRVMSVDSTGTHGATRVSGRADRGSMVVSPSDLQPSLSEDKTVSADRALAMLEGQPSQASLGEAIPTAHHAGWGESKQRNKAALVSWSPDMQDAGVQRMPSLAASDVLQRSQPRSSGPMSRVGSLSSAQPFVRATEDPRIPDDERETMARVECVAGTSIPRTSTSTHPEALQAGWVGGELWPLWDATCCALLVMHLLFQLIRVFGGLERPKAGRDVIVEDVTGWWQGGGDLGTQLDTAAASDVLAALAFLLLLLGGLRFWRSSRVLVMGARLSARAMAPATAVVLMMVSLLGASASRRVILHVHSPACQPSWGHMFSNALDQLMTFDAAGAPTEEELRAGTRRVRGEALSRRSRQARKAVQSATWGAGTSNSVPASVSVMEWPAAGSSVHARTGLAPGGRACHVQGVWPSHPPSDTSSHWWRTFSALMDGFELALHALLVGPLCFVVILQSWWICSQPETRNMRPPTAKEKAMYTHILWQDVAMLRSWASRVYAEFKQELWRWLHDMPRSPIPMANDVPFDPDYDASEYEPYTDADCWRSVYEAVDAADLAMEERLRTASCFMLRVTAPLVSSLDQLRALPIDLQESPYAAPAAIGGAEKDSREPLPLQSEGAAGRSTAGGALIGSPLEQMDHHQERDEDLEHESASAIQMLGMSHLGTDDAFAFGDLDVEEMDDEEMSEVMTPVARDMRVPKGLDLRLMVKVEQLRGVDKLPVPATKGFGRKAKTLHDHLVDLGGGLTFEFLLGNLQRAVTWEGIIQDDEDEKATASASLPDARTVGIGAVLPTTERDLQPPLRHGKQAGGARIRIVVRLHTHMEHSTQRSRSLSPQNEGVLRLAVPLTQVPGLVLGADAVSLWLPCEPQGEMLLTLSLQRAEAPPAFDAVTMWGLPAGVTSVFEEMQGGNRDGRMLPGTASSADDDESENSI